VKRNTFQTEYISNRIYTMYLQDQTPKIKSQFYAACKSGNINQLKRLSSHLTSEHIKMDNHHFFVLVGAYGHLNVAEWIVKTYVVNFEESISGSVDGFREACANGHLHVISWFVDVFKFNPECDNGNYGFQLACKKGHLDIAKWFEHRFMSLLTRRRHESLQALNDACSSGHLELTEWLIDTFKFKVESSVSFVCYNNRIQILQMYITKNLLSSSSYHFFISCNWRALLKTACHEENKFMVFWFVTNFPDLEIPEKCKSFTKDVLEENDIMIKPASKRIQYL